MVHSRDGSNRSVAPALHKYLGIFIFLAVVWETMGFVYNALHTHLAPYGTKKVAGNFVFDNKTGLSRPGDRERLFICMSPQALDWFAFPPFWFVDNGAQFVLFGAK